MRNADLMKTIKTGDIVEIVILPHVFTQVLKVNFID